MNKTIAFILVIVAWTLASLAYDYVNNAIPHHIWGGHIWGTP